MEFLNQLLGAERSYARAQLGVSKICLEQQLYRNLMCNMCGMNGGSCYCGPCGGAGVVASNCCIDSSNVTHETITLEQAKKTILLYLASEDAKAIVDQKTLHPVVEEAKNNSSDQSVWPQIDANVTTVLTKPGLLALITDDSAKKRFAVYLIEKKGATFVQQ